MDDGSDRYDRRAEDDLPWPPELVAGNDSRHGTYEAANIVNAGHGALHVGRGMTERLCRWVQWSAHTSDQRYHLWAAHIEKVLIDNDIAENLVVSVPTAWCNDI